MRLFYSFAIALYSFAVRVAALFGHRKARLMADGWRQWPQTVANLCHDRPVAWFHAASLGEFEQARPVLEAYRLQHPDSSILLTFFSPSGYEVRRHYPLADAVCYLPPDTLRSSRRFADAVRADVAFFVKYDFWFNHLDALRRRSTPTYLFSAIFRPNQYFFAWYGCWFRRQLASCYTHIFVQNSQSLALLQSHGVGQCSLAGDTRFDRVHQIALAAEPDPIVEGFLRGSEGQVMVCGSTWPPDEELLARLADEWPQLRIILAPHVISQNHLLQIEHLLKRTVRYSALKDIENPASLLNPVGTAPASILLIDNIGLLSKLYRYATVAYIGGGFGAGIHNILEAVTFGKPVLFGPNHAKFQEALDILACGGGFCHTDFVSLQSNLSPLLTNPSALQRSSQACLEYMQRNLGSTDIILHTIEK